MVQDVILKTSAADFFVKTALIDQSYHNYFSLSEESVSQISKDITTIVFSPGDKFSHTFQTERNVSKCILSLPWEEYSTKESGPVSCTECVAEKDNIQGNGNDSGILWLIVESKEHKHVLDPVIVLVASKLEFILTI